jgi:stage II sporulation protein AA (anti-sigma F factor antagonist)
MEVTENKQNEVVVVSVQGRVDASNAGALEQKLFGLIAGGEKRLVLDAARLDYISSAGLRALLVARKRLPTGGSLALCALQPQIREILEIAGLSSLFPIHETRDDAIAVYTEREKGKEER